MKKLTPLRAIKEYCKLTCCSNDRKSLTDCTLIDCPLWNFRFGTKQIPERYTKENKQAV